MDFAAFGDIIFFALLAGYVWFKLRATLGRKDDAVPPSHPLRQVTKAEERAPGIGRLPAAPKANPAVIAPREAKPVKQPVIKNEAVAEIVRQIQQRDRSFTAGHFLEGAGMAFEMVLEAYGKGETASLKGLLEPALFTEFKEGIDQRKAAGETLDITIVSINETDIIDARLEKSQAEIRVRFTSEQISVLKDSSGKILEGNPSQITQVVDEWVFRRDISSANPNWTIIAT